MTGGEEGPLAPRVCLQVCVCVCVCVHVHMCMCMCVCETGTRMGLLVGSLLVDVRRLTNQHGAMLV